MHGFLHKLRSRPLRERQRIIYGSAFVVTLIVCGLWVTLLQYDKHNQEDSASRNDQFAPLKSLTDGISSMWSNAKYSVPKAQTMPDQTPPVSDSSGEPSSAETPQMDEIEQSSGGQIILKPQPTPAPTSTPINE